MRITLIGHPTAKELEIHDGSVAFDYTLRDAQGNAIGQRTSTTIGVPDEYCASRFAVALGLETDTPAVWRVSKDTLIGRVLAAGALPQVMAALAAQSEEQQFVFAQSAWFWSTNPTLRGLCGALGLNADEILAPDPYL
jgi:hypothetical protein